MFSKQNIMRMKLKQKRYSPFVDGIVNKTLWMQNMKRFSSEKLNAALLASEHFRNDAVNAQVPNSLHK